MLSLRDASCLGLRSEPIYDALTTRAANAAKQNADEAPPR
jgi:hypothetical protein